MMALGDPNKAEPGVFVSSLRDKLSASAKEAKTELM